MGERRHAFEDGGLSYYPLPSGLAGGPAPVVVCRRCGLPPDAEVHQAGRFISTEQPGELNAPPLPSTEKPAEARCATCGKPAVCIGRNEEAAEETFACDDCCGHGCLGEKPSCRLLASPPPQAQPEETPREEWHDECPGFAWGHRCESCAPPPAQPDEGEPKRVEKMAAALLLRAQEVLRKIDAIITPESSPYSEDEEPDTSTCARCHNFMDHRGGDGYECDVCVQELFGLIREAFPKSEARRFFSDLDSALKGVER